MRFGGRFIGRRVGHIRSAKSEPREIVVAKIGGRFGMPTWQGLRGKRIFMNLGLIFLYWGSYFGDSRGGYYDSVGNHSRMLVSNFAP